MTRAQPNRQAGKVIQTQPATIRNHPQPVRPAIARDTDHRATLRGGLPDRYLTPNNIAEMFEVPLETVYQWRRKRLGPPGFRIGKHVRYDPADVRTYVSERKSADQDAA